jgi:hypothetical protein
MTWYTYPILPAIDPSTGLPVRNLGGQVFAPTDTSFATPLNVFDLAGVPLAGNVIVVTNDGVTTQFRVQDQPVVTWKSGSYILGLSSPQGLLDAATAAQAAAETAEEILASAPQILPAGGTPGDVLFRSVTEYQGAWGPAPVGAGGSGGSVTWDAVTLKPTTFPASPHTHPASQVSDSTPVGRSVLTASDAATARSAIGAGTGNGTSNLQVGPGATDAAAGNHVHAASAVLFTPTGGVTATDVQAAIGQAATMGGGGGAGSAVYVWRYTAGAWPAMPATAPGGVYEVRALGPSFPTTLPGWVGLAAGKVPLSYSKVNVA